MTTPRQPSRLRATAAFFACFITLLLPCALVAADEKEKPVRVVVWDEQQPAQKPAYKVFLGNAIAEHLKSRPGFTVDSVKLDDPEQGLPAALLDRCDVLVWWGHVRHRDVKDELAKGIVERIKSGKLSLIALHSAHWSKPFVEAMCERTRSDALKSLTAAQRESVKIEYVGPKLYTVPKRTDALTPSSVLRKNDDGTQTLVVTLPLCVFPAYRADGKPSHVTTLLPDHAVAKGVPRTFDIPQTEMYDDPFHVPAPDATVFEEKWDAGEKFRSGSLWDVGKGKVFYFRPGHETYPVYRQALPLLILENACRYLADQLPK